jgi:2-amino-4-hydroxy-6-hydroxymethyldihydropteridine diphosphokinase
VRDAVTAYVGVGANLGDARQAVARAIDDLGRLPGTRLVARSSLYRSAPVDASGPDYVNAVAALETQFTAPDLLSQLLAMEQRAGRERPWRHAPRTLDVDLLLYGAARIDSPALTVPHPRWQERAFVLLPLAEIAPALVSARALDAVTSQVIARIP